ncbi:transposase family protein [Nostoc sp. CHAB 5784]|nr:transposase family protein [Nostoc mirabile CHAB5784]
MQDQLLMTLEYWREYRTYFHIAHIPHFRMQYINVSINITNNKNIT